MHTDRPLHVVLVAFSLARGGFGHATHTAVAPHGLEQRTFLLQSADGIVALAGTEVRLAFTARPRW